MTTVVRFSRPLHVLVAEDNRVNQRLVVGLLQRLGHTAEVACSGTEAVAIAARGRFDLALMDLRMPGLDGIAATAAIRQREDTTSTPHLPIVALTAADLEVERARCLDAGMDRCLMKPVTPQELADVLAWVSSRGNGSTEAGTSDAVPAIDPVTMEWYRGLDTDFLGTLIDEFLAEAPRRIGALHDAHVSGDAAALRFEAHALKGSARVFGAAPLADLCAVLERAQSIDEETRIGWERLEAEMRRVRAALEMAHEGSRR
jgi:CheY-like chemotaxis protein